MPETTQILPITRENYREYDALNYSRLSSLDIHPSKVSEPIEGEGLTKGDILDLLCFDGEDAVNQKYYISTFNEYPSEAIIQIIKTARQKAKADEDDDPYSDKNLLYAASINNYGASNWKEATILKKIKENGGEDYMYMLSEAGDKPIIDFELFSEMKEGARILKNHSFTKQYFEEANYQIPLVGELTGVTDTFLFKGLLDIVKLPIVADLKFTSSPLTQFRSSFLSYRYYIQAALYSDLMAKQCGYVPKFYYVLYSAYDKNAGVYLVSEKDIEVGRNGGYLKNGRYVKGYRQLGEDLNWHIQNNKWDYPREVYENDGVVETDCFATLDENNRYFVAS